MKKITLMLFALVLGGKLFAQTSLNPGDIAFLGWNLDGADDYTFILLKDVDASTQINFTDCGWTDGTSSFVCNTGDANGWTWTSGANLSCGQTITITVPPLSASIGSVSGSAGVMSSLGDQILAYQGIAASPSFVAGMHSDQAPTSANDANWSGNVTNNQTSALPDVLTTGTDAIRLHNGGSESDNWQYNCAVASGNASVVRAAINNISNWVNDNGTAYTPVDPGCSWSVSCIPMPVELVYFEAMVYENQGVSVSWSSATETNNSKYIVERSFDGRNWEAIGDVPGAGTSSTAKSYNLVDRNPREGTSYYRLSQMDFDGSITYSSFEVVSYTVKNTSMTIFPNPVMDEMHVRLNYVPDTPVRVTVYNRMGQIVMQEMMENTNELKLNVSRLTSGLYILESRKGNEILTNRFLVR